MTGADEVRRRDIEFLSLMAHDLRQPLNVVIGTAIALEDRWDKLGDEQKLNYVRLIARSGTWMRAIVDDIMVAGEAVGDGVAFTPVSFSLTALAEETIHDLVARDEGRLNLHVSADLPLGYGDPVKQRQVLQNLLDNALKYSRSPIHVGIDVRNEMLSVSIADRGVGVSPADIPTLFDRYSRVTDEEHTTLIHGSGLGLFVCRAMVNAQGGEIGVENNTNNVGSVFTYTLPIAG